MKPSDFKLNIAIVSDAIYPYNIGGKEKRIHEISTRLALIGHKVTIYCMEWPGMDKNRKTIGQYNNIILKPISPYYPLYFGNRRSIKQAILFSFHCLLLLREDFDLIDADHMPHLVLFPLKVVTIIKRKKLIATWNEVWGRKYWVEYLGIIGNIAYLIEYISARLPDEIIAVSKHTRSQLVNSLKVKSKVTVGPNGIDLYKIEKIKPSQIQSDIIFAGRLIAHKNVDLLIKAISVLRKVKKDIRCVIVGEGPEEKYLKQLTIDLKLSKNIVFYDFLKDHDKLYALMKSSKVFVLPSTREGFGIVVLEANACGIPVITIDHKDNAAKDLIKKGENGYLVGRNVQDLVEKISLCLDNTKKPEYEEYVSDYDWQKISKRIERAYGL